MRSPLRFCAVWLAATVTLLFALSVFDAMVDPYSTLGMPRVPGFNALKPDAKPHLLMAKTYEVERVRPMTVLLGTSRVDIGFDPQSRLWPSRMRPVFNYGIDGANLTRIFANLREAAATGRVARVFVLVEFELFWFRDRTLSVLDEGDRRYLLTSKGMPNPYRRVQRLRDIFLSTLTLGALDDSADTLLRQHHGAVSDLTLLGLTTEGEFQRQARNNGYYDLFIDKMHLMTAESKRAAEALAAHGGHLANMTTLHSFITFCRQHGIAITLIIPPYNTGLLEIFRAAGLWGAYIQWKRELVTALPDGPGPPVTLWDFSEPSGYTSEPPPTKRTDTRIVQWYWEYVHFKKALGDKMLARILGQSIEPFGFELTLAATSVGRPLANSTYRTTQ